MVHFQGLRCCLQSVVALLKLFRPGVNYSTLDMRKYSFSQRGINEWNKLSNECVNASSVNMFKNRIDKYLIRAGYT